MATELVGRDRELDNLAGWLDEAFCGSPRLVQLSGDAGVGKSTLAAAMVRAAQGRGCAVTVGRATELDGAPPFRPWQQILGTIDGSALLDPVASLDPAVDRFACFDAVLDHLLAAAVDADGLLVVLEDVHRGDEPSIRLLAHVGEGLTSAPICVLMTGRSRNVEQSGVWAATAPVLARLPGARRLELAGIGSTAVAELLGPGHPDGAATRVFEVTGGNPLFVRELARHVDAGGDLDRIPTSVVDAVRVRLADRTDRCVEALRVAAVIGREFSAGVLATALGVAARTCLEAIEEAERAGFVESMGHGRFRFVHILVRDAVEADLGAADLAGTHRRIAEAIEVEVGAGDEHLADLARHWAASAVLGDGDIAARWCERAAAAADRHLAWEDAARLYDRAAAVAGPGADPVDRHRWLLGSARARLHCDDISTAVDLCVRAVDEIRDLHRADLLAEAALVIEGRGGPPMARLRDLADEALTAVDAEDDALRARLLGQLAACSFYVEPSVMVDLSAAAMDAAQRSGDPLALVSAARARQMATAGPEHAEERLGLASVIGAAGRSLSRPSVIQWEPIWRIDALVELGRLPEAVAELVELRRRIEDVGLPMSRFHLYRIEALLAQATGRFADALVWGQRTCDVFSLFEDPLGGAAMLNGLRTHVGLHTGIDSELLDDFDAIDLDRAPPFLGDLPLLQPVLVLLSAGQPDRARLLYDRMAPVATWDPPRFLWLHLHSLRLVAAIGLDRTDDVDALADELDRHRDVHVAAGAGGLTYSGPIQLWTGTAASARKRWDSSVHDLREAYRLCADNGAKGFAVQAGVELARALLQRDGSDDVAAAGTVLAGVEPLAATLGMAPWATAITDLRQQLASSGADPGPDTGPLSPREFEVAGLVAQGLTNRAIAEQLFLSPRTAQNHVQHILTKLGATRRAQIATWYARR